MDERPEAPPLLLQVFADVFDDLAHLTLGRTVSLADVATRFVGLALGLQRLVISEVAGGLLGLTLQLFHLALELVLVHVFPPAQYGALVVPEMVRGSRVHLFR